MSAMATKTLQTVQSARNASEHSELVATAFQNYVHLLKKHPDYFAQGGVDPQALLDCACFSVHLPEQAPVKVATSYMTYLASSASPGQPGNVYLSPCVRGSGLRMVKEAVKCAVTSDPSTDNADLMTNVFFYRGKYFYQEYCAWLEAVVAEDGFPGPAIPRERKEEFARALIREKANKRKMQEATRDFAATCISLQGKRK